jgi:hypothetical protein
MEASGQMTNAGSVSGQVTDPSNAVVQNAAVKLTDPTTGVTQSTSTNASGRYIFSNVPPGIYTISVEKPGFSKTTISNQPVKIGVPLTQDVKLTVGAATQVVEVQATNVELQTENATIGNTVSGLALNSLPSLNRDVSTFVELQPGVSPDGSVAGAVVDQSSFQLDGGNNTNDMDGSMTVYTSSYAGDPTGGVSNQSFAVAAGPTGVMPTPADSVEEFKVNTANQTADFNSSSGAQVQLVTRRGANEWHGSVYEYYLDNSFSANTWDNNFTGTPLPTWHRNRFGARIGGPLIPKEILGGKTYIFANYEGFRWPLTRTIERTVPSAAMRSGFLTFDGVTYNLAAADPRGIGINPLVQQIWNTHMPPSNESGCGLSRCDGDNVQGFKANLSVPQNSDFGVIRLDHDFGQKWHFMASYRYYNERVDGSGTSPLGAEQVDIGGFFNGDKLGVPVSLSKDPQLPWYFVVGLTTNISQYVTNDFHWSFLRNWWAWQRTGAVPQLPGLGGALEPFGESATQALIPYNVNTQQTRTRFWDGQDHMIRDDVSILHGTHLFKFGGMYQHNFNWHQRTDNGGGINYAPVYQLGVSSGAGIDISSTFCASVSTTTNCGRDYAAALGIVSISQQAYTRSGTNLALNPPLTPAFDQSTIPYYNFYFSDTWRLKPTFTLTYGLGWTLEMPPTEANGKQVEFVDEANQILGVESYLHTREKSALQGVVYNPTIGFNLVGNTENGRKYPYDPFYGSFSPRVAAAWNPHFDGGGMASKIFGVDKTVIRAGYGRIYGRLNGVDLVLVPLLGTGLIQPVQCIGAQNPAGAAANGPCPGSSVANPANAFRIGIDGLTAPLPPATPTLPQPLFPGINGIAAGAGEALDPHFRPNVVDSFDLTIQRQLSSKVSLEVGYIGRLINHEYQPININSVPYMMTMGGQRFDQAYANVVLQYCGGVQGLGGGNCAANAAAVTPQPFFETALKGTGFCTGAPNCTQALVAAEGASGTGNLTFANVWSLWSDLDTGGATSGFNFPRSMMNSPLAGTAPCPGLPAFTGPCGSNGQLTSGVGINASLGYGNYHAGFVSLKMSDWHGLTAQSNFTWSKDLTTQSVVQATSEDTAVDPFDLGRGYGYAGFDRKFVYNLFLVYPAPFYKDQRGFAGHLLGGWTFAPIFTAGTGLPITLGTINGGGQAFGEGDSINFFGNGNSENAIPMGRIPSSGVHYNVAGSNGIGTAGFGVNLFGDPAAAFNSIRQPILGLDQHDGGWGLIRGLPYWNLDFSIRKSIKVTERVDLEAQAIFINLVNHVVFFDPGPGDYLDTSNPGSWGTLPGQGNTPRTMEFGLRLNF